MIIIFTFVFLPFIVIGIRDLSDSRSGNFWETTATLAIMSGYVIVYFLLWLKLLRKRRRLMSLGWRLNLMGAVWKIDLLREYDVDHLM